MTPGSHESPPTPSERRRRHPWWRLGTPVVVLLCGSLFVVSADNSEGTDLRPGRYTDLASLVAAEAERYEQLQEEVSGLNAEVEQLAGAVESSDVRREQGRVQQLQDPAGLRARSGEGVRVVLSDASAERIQAAQADPDADLNLFVVHQQDIQAVVNAMWRGGAEAVTVQGQRIISTTGIKCEGNSVLLQGVPYPQPYTIEAVGDPGEIATSLQADERIAYFRARADQTEVGVGWEFVVEERVTAPAYDGLLDLSYAQPLS